MKRFLSVWLPRWSIERRFGHRALQSTSGTGLSPHNKAFALSTMAESGARLTAVNEPSEALGLSINMALTDARAIHPDLEVASADFDGDEDALVKLANWARRYSPLVRTDLPDGFTIDITGAAHLFGGEAAMMEDIEKRLHRFGLSTQLAIAPSIGSAWALAHYGCGVHFIAAKESLREHLAPLPVAALRIDETVRIALIKMGFKHISDLLGKPRAPLATRFGRKLILRLDQALDEESEAFHALSLPPLYRVMERFAEPVITLQDIEHVIHRLISELVEGLHKAGKGARHLELVLFRVDGWFETLQVRTSSVSQDGAHFARLFKDRLDQIEDHTGFGFELMTLSAFDTELVDTRQHIFVGEDETRDDGSIAPLLDRFVNRFGLRSVTRFYPRASYIPEHATRSVPVLRQIAPADWAAHVRHAHDDTPFGRPLLLFTSPEPINVLVEMPDNPPERFEWRRISHRVTRAEGPERLGPEWWRLTETENGKRISGTRDYYRVEDDTGRRFWLYREGLYDRDGDLPRWFIHGLFS